VRILIWLRHPGAALASRVIVGGFFIVAGAAKLYQPAGLFANQIKSFGILPGGWEPPLAAILPWLELVAGVFLFAGLMSRRAAVLIGLQLALFAAALSAAMLLGTAPEDCGCLPGVSETPAQALVRDAVMIAWLIGSYRGLPGYFSLDRWLETD